MHNLARPLTTIFAVALLASTATSAEPAAATPAAAETAVLKLSIPSRGPDRNFEVHPRYYRGLYQNSTGPVDRGLRPAEPRADFERRVEWLHQAKYGVMYHYLANLHALPGLQWTSESWNAAVDAVDVDKFADQVQEVRAGYVILPLGQNCRYACAPNPVIDKYWELKPGEYNSRRDLPMDLSKALKKRGIRTMLYVATDNQHKLPRPASLQGADRFKYWTEAMQWYGDHYGQVCDGWWVDGLKEYVPGYTQGIHDALRHGNPSTLIGSGSYVFSDFLHGHCCIPWGPQQSVLPHFGQFDPDYGLQWQALQYLGREWGQPGVTHSNASMVNYAKRIVTGGGVITFDLGTRNEKHDLVLEISASQMDQLRLIRDAVKEIPVTDGATVRQATLQKTLLSEEGEKIRLHNVWPVQWTDTFTLHAAHATTLVGRVENGVLVELKISPTARAKDVFYPGHAPDGNLALDRPARLLTADGRADLPASGGDVAWHGVDGDGATGAKAGRQFGWTYEVDLGEAARIGRLSLAFNPQAYATAFRVLVSDDRERWSVAYEEKEAKGNPVDTKIEPVAARYLRVVADKPDGPNQPGTQMQIMELKVFP